MKSATSSQYIADNFENIKTKIKERFREDVVIGLRARLDPSQFDYEYPNKVSGTGIAQIYIVLKELEKTQFQFMIESFSGFGHHNGALFIGVYDHTGKNTKFPNFGTLDGFNEAYWKSTLFSKFEDERIDLKSNKFLRELVDPESKIYKNILEDVVQQCTVFIESKYPEVEAFFRNINYDA